MNKESIALYQRAHKFGWEVRKQVTKTRISKSLLRVDTEYEAVDNRGRVRAMFSTHVYH